MKYHPKLDKLEKLDSFSRKFGLFSVIMKYHLKLEKLEKLDSFSRKFSLFFCDYEILPEIREIREIRLIFEKV